MPFIANVADTWVTPQLKPEHRCGEWAPKGDIKAQWQNEVLDKVKARIEKQKLMFESQGMSGRAEARFAGLALVLLAIEKERQS